MKLPPPHCSRSEPGGRICFDNFGATALGFALVFFRFQFFTTCFASDLRKRNNTSISACVSSNFLMFSVSNMLGHCSSSVGRARMR